MFRLPPVGQVQDYQTYQIVSPLNTHWRPATCSEVDCPQYVNGWRVRIEGLPAAMLHTARASGRKFSELHVAENENWLVFEAGQPCFRASEHRKLLDRQEIFIARDGDYRGNPTGRVRKHTKPEHWIEDFSEHQQKLVDQVNKG